MPMRVYCPDCSAPRTAPAAGARVRCRVCDRVFRAGARVDRRDRDRAPVRNLSDQPGAQKFLLVLGGIALVVVGLTFGAGVAGWYFLTHQPPCEVPDDEVIAADDDPGPLDPRARPPGHPPPPEDVGP